MKNVNDHIVLLGDDRRYEVMHAHGKRSVIQLQTGVVGPLGDTNGCQVEDLIDISIDRLETFQAGEFPCPENKAAIKALKAAKSKLNKRTAAREKQEVEGKMEPHENK